MHTCSGIQHRPGVIRGFFVGVVSAWGTFGPVGQVAPEGTEMTTSRKRELTGRMMEAFESPEWSSAMDVELILEDMGEMVGEAMIIELCNNPHQTYGEAFEKVASGINS